MSKSTPARTERCGPASTRFERFEGRDDVPFVGRSMKCAKGRSEPIEHRELPIDDLTNRSFALRRHCHEMR